MFSFCRTGSGPKRGIAEALAARRADPLRQHLKILVAHVLNDLIQVAVAISEGSETSCAILKTKGSNPGRKPQTGQTCPVLRMYYMLNCLIFIKSIHGAPDTF